MPRTRIVLADEDVLLRDLLRIVLLAYDIEVVGDVSTTDDLLRACEECQPDVVVSNVWLADGGIERALPAITLTGARVIVLSADAAAHPVNVVAHGASGYLLHDCTPERIAEAVLAVAAGDVALHPTAASAIVEEWRQLRRDSGTPLSGGTLLTPRESDVLAAMGEGLATKAIARRLGMAIKTVENHKTRIFDKLGARSQAHAVSLAMGLGLLTGDRPAPTLGSVVT